MTATVPESPQTSQADRHDRSQLQVDERFRAWRAVLEALPGFGPDGPQVVLIASAEISAAQAGLGIARAFAHARQRTLLIDGTGGDIDGNEQMNGSQRASEALAMWLSNGAEASSSATFSAAPPMLMTLPLCVDGKAGDVIAPATFQRLFSWARQERDRIIMVVRPMLVSADSLLLARWADCVVMGVRPGHTTRGMAVQARDDLIRAGGVVVGAISLD